MVDQDVVIEKIKQIKQCLKRIQEKTQGKSEALGNIDTQDVFVLNLQRAVQSTIDLAAHVVSSEKLGIPSEMRENFTLLEKAGLLPKDLCENLKHMVGFRNIAIHDYSAIDVEVLKSILTQHLKDLEEFYRTLMRHFGLSIKK